MTLRVSERDLTGYVRDLARALGWRRYHTWLAKHSPAGFPDEVLLRVPRLVFAELKAEGKTPTPAQAEWLDDLAACGYEVCVWTPSMLDAIAAYLQQTERPEHAPGAWKGSGAPASRLAASATRSRSDNTPAAA